MTTNIENKNNKPNTTTEQKRNRVDDKKIPNP